MFAQFKVPRHKKVILCLRLIKPLNYEIVLESGGIVSRILNLSSRFRSVVSITPPSFNRAYPTKAPRVAVGQEALWVPEPSGRWGEERRNLLFLPGIESHFMVVQLVACLLY